MNSRDHSYLAKIAHQAMDDARDVFDRSPIGKRTSKGDRDFTTEVDFAIERLVRDQLAAATPEIGFVGEENGGNAETDRWWCLDPIDGTVNFALGTPLCAISLALVENNAPVLGVIDAPRLGTRYSAVAGKGAVRNGEPITVSETSQLSDAVLTFGDFAVGADKTARYQRQRDLFHVAVSQAQRVRMLGTAALDLAWLADGKHAASIIIGGNFWDVAAGEIIAREAGAVILQSPFHGDPATIACTPGLRASLADLIKQSAGPATAPK